MRRLGWIEGAALLGFLCLSGARYDSARLVLEDDEDPGRTAPPTAAGGASGVVRASRHIADLAWLAGCWERRGESSLYREQWMAPAGGMMMGMSHSAAGDATREFEQLRIEEKDGQLAYVALPSGQELATFTSTACSDTLVVFENLAHDFPQRVIYRRRADGSLLARIEGMRDGQLRGVDFPLFRASCP